MQLDDRSTISESHLRGYSVLDQHGYLLGQVIAVKRRSADDISLVVQFPASQMEMDNLIVEAPHVIDVDNTNNLIQTDLDFNLVVPQQGKTIPLVAEQAIIRRQRHKVGEVVVRKVVETDWVQVPVHRERLVVEQAGRSEPLAEIDLGRTRVSGDAEIATTPLREGDRYTESLGQWPSIRESLPHLNRLAAEATVPGVPVNVTLMLAGNPPQPVHMQVPSLRVAARMLTTLGNEWEHSCQSVYLERL